MKKSLLDLMRYMHNIGLKDNDVFDEKYVVMDVFELASRNDDYSMVDIAELFIKRASYKVLGHDDIYCSTFAEVATIVGNAENNEVK